ncbi:hypothetical protein [Micromonospora zamorensis]|uniref:hypothetical protein n=1 Tax=Micromonospora zamorensis TaxID=709883 RepID=UPI003CEE0EEA
MAERLCLRLRLEPYTNTSFPERVIHHTLDEDLLIVVDAIIQLHPGWKAAGVVARGFVERLFLLDSMLLDGASALRVDFDGRCLVRRLDSTAEAAARLAISAASPSAADHLAAAWVATYGLAPDPDKAFSEAIRAVEEVACPLVEQRKAEKNLATLGTVLGELKGNAHDKWELSLPDKGGQRRGVTELVGMMEVLWQAQVSRHGGGQKSRRQEQEEAEAAVNLAVLLVHWLSTGVLRRKA